jgi:hypothetical protein
MGVFPEFFGELGNLPPLWLGIERNYESHYIQKPMNKSFAN